MAEKEQVNIKLPSSQKQRWKDYEEESDEFSNLSHLIRTSVEREINRDMDYWSTKEQEIDFSELQTQINRMEGSIRGLREDIESVRMLQAANSGLEELKQNVIRFIPSSDREFDVYEEVNEDDLNGEFVRPISIANHFPDAEDADMVYEALEELRDEIASVKRVRVAETGENSADFVYYKVI